MRRAPFLRLRGFGCSDCAHAQNAKEEQTGFDLRWIGRIASLLAAQGFHQEATC
jgi:hypothetical protein